MLIGTKVSLRHVEQDDLDDLVKAVNDPGSRGDYLHAQIYSRQNIRKEFAENGMSGEKSAYLLITANGGVTVGFIAHYMPYSSLNGRELGYLIFHSNNRNSGYASEAVRLLVGHLFSGLPLNRLQVRVDPSNRPAVRVAEKNGFVMEGTLRQANFVNGHYTDLALYSLLR